MVRAGSGLILIVIGLLSIGVVMVTSAGLVVGRGDPIGLADVLLGRHALFAAIAITLLLVGSRVPLAALDDRRGLASPAPWIVLVSVLLLLAVHVPGLGREVNGARRWIEIGPIGFQPSEVVKWGLLFVIASYAARRAASMGRLGLGFLLPVGLVGVIGALIATEDLGTAALITAVCVAVLFAAGARIWHAVLLVPAGVAAFALAVLASPYRLDRLRAFLDPYADPQGIGYHVLQSLAAISGGGFWGRGLGHGVQKFGYLPEDTTDFVFAVIAEELGAMGVAAVVCLYAALLWCGLAVIARADRPFTRLLALGIVLMIGGQAVMNMLVVTGLAPTKGIALPLLSAGGTGWCLTAFSVGLLVSIERSAGLVPAGRSA